jgi:large subunit ribosomal protein L16
MLQPKKTAYRKQHKGRNKGIATNGTKVNFGEYGLKTLDIASITSRQIESARRAITHYIKRGGKVWIRIFPDKPITRKPMEVRMGNGKGNVEYWVALVQPGKVIFELEGVSSEIAQKALTLAGAKLPVKTMFVTRTIK